MGIFTLTTCAQTVSVLEYVVFQINDLERKMNRVFASLFPPSLRLVRSRWLHWMRQDTSHFERSERAEFFRLVFRALAFNGTRGDYAEFGCCGAQTFALAHAELRKNALDCHMWAFDSFEGLPPQSDGRDAHPMWVGGDMAISVDQFRKICDAHGIAREAYTIVPGYFDRSLAVGAASERPADIALAYIDCDLYSSTLEVLAFLAPRLRHGMILAFDDYYCWSDTRVSGERLALIELAEARPDLVFAPYLSFGWHGQSFVVEAADQLRPDTAAVARLRAASPAGELSKSSPSDADLT